MSTRQHERFGFFRKTNWDFFTGSTGRKSGYITNISRGGCLLKASDPIDHRRWVRLVIQDAHTNLCYTAIGRVIRREDAIEAITENEVTLYRYGIEFTYPGFLSAPPQAAEPTEADQDLILALSSKNFNVRSCRSLNVKSSLRPGFLA